MSCALILLLLGAPPSETATRTLTLDEAVELALGTDPTVGAARIVRDRSQLAVLRAQLDRFSLKVDAQLQELWTQSNIGGDQEGAFTGGLGLSNASASLNVPVFSGFRVESNVGRAEDLEDAADQDVRSQRKDVSLAVARAYWSVRKLGLLRDVQARALDRLRNAEQIARSRVRAGLASAIDENRASSRRLLQEVTLADLDGSLLEATAQLAVALGIDDRVTLIDEPRIPERLPPPVDRLIDDALGARPEVLSAKKRFDAQRESVDIAASGYYPQLSVFGLFQYGNNPFLAGVGSRAVFASTNPFSNTAGDFQVGATLSINLFDTLNTYTAVKDAEYEQSRLAEEIRRVGRVVESDVRTARARVLHLHQVRSRLAPAEAVARDNVEIIQKRYENGEALVFELLDTEIELLDVERRIADTTSELQLAWLELDASLGSIIGDKE